MESPAENISISNPILEMYQVSGQDKISMHSFDRYRRDKDRDEKQIFDASTKQSAEDIKKTVETTNEENRSKLIADGLNTTDHRVQKAYADTILLAPLNERASLIKIGLKCEDLSVQLASANKISYVPQLDFKELSGLIRDSVNQIINNKYFKEIDKIVNMIGCTSQEDTSRLLKTCAESSNRELTYESLRLIMRLSKDNLSELRQIISDKIQSNLVNSSGPESEIYAEMIRYVAPDQKSQLVQTGIKSTNEKIRSLSVNYINDVQEGELDTLIRIGLQSKDPYVQEKSAIEIRRAASNKRNELLRLGLVSDSHNVRVACASQLHSVPQVVFDELQEYITDTIVTGLQDGKPEIRIKYITVIRNALPKSKPALLKESIHIANSILEGNDLDLQNKLIDLKDDFPEPVRDIINEHVESAITNGLRSNDLQTQYKSIDAIFKAPRDLRIKLLLVGLNSEFKEIIKICIDSLFNSYEKIGPDFLNQIEKNKLEEILISPPLYKNSKINKDQFSRSGFDKTGSETILFGGSLKDRTILRRIKASAFLNWQKLYENYKLWKNEGFDYVPIEPIQSFKWNEKDDIVDIYTGVLDLSVANWSRITDRYRDEISKDVKKISIAVASQGIVHGHEHTNNFILRFFRDEQGKPDLHRKPRVYLIDFDAASS